MPLHYGDRSKVSYVGLQNIILWLPPCASALEISHLATIVVSNQGTFPEQNLPSRTHRAEMA